MKEQLELKKLLHYDHQTGIFTWIKPTARRIKAGDVAGSIDHQGYAKIRINNKLYSAHRLAWLYVYGYVPKIIDHINRNRADNRIENLREVSVNQNQWNSNIRKDNKSGIKGVSFNTTKNKWVVQCTKNNKKYHGGYFNNIEEAKIASLKMIERLHCE
jgi:hypothetical protein